MPDLPYSFRLNPDYQDEREVKDFLDEWVAHDKQLPREQQLGLRGIMTQIISSYMKGNPRPIVSRQEYRLERAITEQVSDLRDEMRDYFEDLERRLQSAVINPPSSVATEQNDPQGDPLDEVFVDSIVNDFERHRRKKRK